MTNSNSSKIEWLQWTSKKSGVLTAYAVNMAAPAIHSVHAFQAFGQRRALNGAIVPANAEPAHPSTPRDAFSERLVAAGADGIGKNTAAHLNPDIITKQIARSERKAAKTQTPAPEPVYDPLELRVRGVDPIEIVRGKDIHVCSVRDERPIKIVVSDKSWAVYHAGKRIAFKRHDIPGLKAETFEFNA